MKSRKSVYETPEVKIFALYEGDNITTSGGIGLPDTSLPGVGGGGGTTPPETERD